MGEERTRNGQIFDQLIRIGSSEPFGEFGFWEFFANDWSHVKGFEFVENALQLQRRIGRRMMRWLANFFLFLVRHFCALFFGMVVNRRLGLRVTVRMKSFGRHRDRRIESRIIRMRRHDLGFWK